MKKGFSKKKIFSLIMVISIILGMLPMTASALAPGLHIGEVNEYVDTPPGSLSPGEIWIGKSIEYVGDGTFEITLSAAGRQYENIQSNKVDVVLVLDTSWSMVEGGSDKFEDMQKAAKDAVDTILGPGSENRVAIVSFDGWAELEKDFTDDIDDLEDAIDDLEAEYYTNTQNAFLVAMETILERENDSRKPVIILISDGKPSFYHENLGIHNEANREGSGLDYEATGVHVYWTIQQALLAKSIIEDLDIYTIGIGVGDDELAVATLMPTESNTYDIWPDDKDPFDDETDKYWTKCILTGEAGIADALKEIVATVLSEQPHSKDGDEYSNIIFEDVIGEGFELVTDSDEFEYDADENKVVWTIDGDEFAGMTLAVGDDELEPGNILTISFEVKISDSAGAGEYYTNDTSLTKATITVAEGNHFFEESDLVTVPFENTGWLILEEIPITITKEVLKSPKTLSGGKATFNYKIVVKNIGTETLTDVYVADEMESYPSGAELTYSDEWKDKFESGDYYIGELAPGAEVTIEYSLTVNKAGDYVNTATATGYYGGALQVMAAKSDNGSEGEYVSASASATATAKKPSPGPDPEPDRGTVIVSYVDVDGNELSADEILTGRVGRNYETEAKDIPGYTLTEVPDNATGIFVDGTITVEYVYEEEEKIEEEEIPEGTPEEPIIDEELPEALPQTGLPIVTVPELFGGALIALGLYFGRKSKKEEEE